jgi:phage terminase small subunit
MTKLTAVTSNSPESLAPKHLKPLTRAWFDQIVREYELESQHLRILQMAAESWDTYECARDSLAENGFTFVNKKHGDIKPRPEVAIAQNSRLAFLRCMRELNLDVQPPDAPRPKPLKYSR